MKEKAFIDTGFWIALIDNKDDNHEITINNLQTILNNFQLYTSDFIIFETLTYLNCSVKNHALALEFLKKITEDQFIIIIDIGTEIKSKSMEIFNDHSDKRLSFVDCSSFVSICLITAECFVFIN
jgi:uncharacterized protein